MTISKRATVVVALPLKSYTHEPMRFSDHRTPLRRRALHNLTALLISTLLTGVANAEESPLKSGANALLFQVVSNFQLNSFTGSTISLKHHTSPKGAVRLGIGFAIGAGNEKQNADYGYESYVRDWDRSSGDLALSVEKLWYFRPESDVSLFVGIGPLARYSWNVVENVGPSDGPGMLEEKVRSHSFGAVVVMGVEWFPHDRIGMLAQYSTDYVYRWQRRDYEYRSSDSEVRTQHSKSHYGDLSADQVKLGVAAYW